jgi:prophage regulatory protein
MKRPKPASPPPAIEPLPKLLRLPAVLQATGLARSTIYRMIAEGKFPAPIKVAKRAVAWRPDPLRQWMDARPSASR